ncbi:hypothetical protein NESM_000667100 [Novymonas esmeraldas]|uniref:Uncharacterized protein n=1 Tax=Novymonas esmeraldas TaxID=1808958 RepID=A0AAW0EU27_9TRYP
MRPAMSRVLRQKVGADHAWMRRIAARVPPAGLSGSQLQRLVEDELPDFAPAHVGAATLKEAVLQCPQLLCVEGGDEVQATWHVRPVQGQGAAGRLASSPATPEEARALSIMKLQQFCAKRARQHRNTYLPLEFALAKLGISDLSVVDAVLDGSATGLDVDVGVRVKPLRTPRAIVAFVDGDILPAMAVDQMCSELNAVKELSVVTIVRQPGTHALSAVDIVCPAVVPTYLSIERHAHELRLRKPDVRHDVVYMCASSQFRVYAATVAPLNDFPDADVYVCCPTMITLVKAKTVVPFE